MDASVFKIWTRALNLDTSVVANRDICQNSRELNGKQYRS